MLAEARAKGIYDGLHLGDVVAHLQKHAGQAPDDLLIAADTLNYLGDLAPLFAAAAVRLRPGGLFAFSVERLDGDGFRLCPSGRYVHGEVYLRRLAAAHGFAIAVFEEADIRSEAGAPERGMAWVLRCDGAS
jgi:predicted TPR repeat methyltransferase